MKEMNEAEAKGQGIEIKKIKAGRSAIHGMTSWSSNGSTPATWGVFSHGEKVAEIRGESLKLMSGGFLHFMKTSHAKEWSFGARKFNGKLAPWIIK